MMLFIKSNSFFTSSIWKKTDFKDFEMNRIYSSQKKYSHVKPCYFVLFKQMLHPPNRSLLFLYYSNVQRERERTDIPPAHKHVDRLISKKKNYYDWLKNFIGRAGMQKHTPMHVMIFFSYEKERKGERKWETERPQFLLPSAPHSSLLLERCRQLHEEI